MNRRDFLKLMLVSLGAMIVPPFVANGKTDEGENVHSSDCAIYNDPYLPNGECDCGVLLPIKIRGAYSVDDGYTWHDFNNLETKDEVADCLLLQNNTNA